MVHCCVPGCKNTHHHKNKKDEWSGQDSRNYSLHDLPSEDRMDVRELWIMAINRTTLPKDVAVCSDHFTEDCFDEKWEEYKRKYGPTKVKRKLKLDAVPTIFPGRIFIHEKVQRIKENWKNKVLQKQLEMERLRLEREYKDRFKLTQTECTCKCRCKLRRKHFTQQVNFNFKFMNDVGVQFPTDITQMVKDDHSYTQGKNKTGKVINTRSSAAARAKQKTSTDNSPVKASTDTATDTSDIETSLKRKLDESPKKESSTEITEKESDPKKSKVDETEKEDDDEEEEEEEQEEEEEEEIQDEDYIPENEKLQLDDEESGKSDKSN
ncbi:DNA ligase 1-like [Hydractinia symbiolongicarpus]|uniref:DNA ligase 1-like n=1 Tax=Hydractinia symbiolongicarpus TaxID=13093 RepID=UPI00254DBAC6|nr:DNA ligase 1-like [Hydractinia symbiolongicarpus]